MNGKILKCLYAIIFIFLIVLTGNDCSVKRGRRLLVVGLDGLTFDLIRPWVEEGLLPNFERIMKEGAFGNLESSIPALSPTAWTSATTGVNPGKHGIFCFSKGFTYEEGYLQNHYYSAVDRNAPAIWSILTDNEMKSIVINVPFTSPPDTINGIMIAGGPHPNKYEFTYPQEIKERFPDYAQVFFQDKFWEEKKQEYLDYLYEDFNERKSVALELADTEDWDFFMVTFTIPDKIQHYYWRYMDEKHPLYTPEGASRYGSAVRDVYVEMDKVLGEFESRASAIGANFIALSDHGFGPVYWTLNGENFIRKNWPPENRDIFVLSSDKHGGLFTIAFEKPPEVNKQNWEKYSNLTGELKEALESLKDPQTGESLIDTIYHRSNIYSGPMVTTAPDVIAIEKSGYLFVNWDGTEDGKILQKLGEKSFCAHHRRDGILLAKGPDIVTAKELGEHSILDLAPTILYLEGVSIPSYMDGRVLEEMIIRESLERHPPDEAIKQIQLGVKEHSRTLTQEEENALEEQLKAMGYVK